MYLKMNNSMNDNKTVATICDILINSKTIKQITNNLSVQGKIYDKKIVLNNVILNHIYKTLSNTEYVNYMRKRYRNMNKVVNLITFMTLFGKISYIPIKDYNEYCKLIDVEMIIVMIKCKHKLNVETIEDRLVNFLVKNHKDLLDEMIEDVNVSLVSKQLLDKINGVVTNKIVTKKGKIDANTMFSQPIQTVNNNLSTSILRTLNSMNFSSSLNFINFMGTSNVQTNNRSYGNQRRNVVKEIIEVKSGADDLRNIILEEDIETDVHPATHDEECPVTYETFKDDTVYIKCRECYKHFSLNAAKSLLKNLKNNQLKCMYCTSTKGYTGPYKYVKQEN